MAKAAFQTADTVNVTVSINKLSMDKHMRNNHVFFKTLKQNMPKGTLWRSPCFHQWVTYSLLSTS